MIVFGIDIGLAMFGAHPSGARLERIKQSPNFNGKEFQNQVYKPQLSEGTNPWKLGWEFFFKKNKRATPNFVLPSYKTNLKQLDASVNCSVWMGHSSYYIQWAGKRLLVDPVFSGNASPIPRSVRAFEGSDIYSAADMPCIDLLIITHDHWDHLDYKTLLKLKPLCQQIVCPLGVGAHLERWGIRNFIELDWTEKLDLDSFSITATPSHHFSGRSFKRNQALWCSYVITAPCGNLFLSGDGGYGEHLADIGNHFGPIDYAFLENGQYNSNWKYIHMKPEEVLQAAKDLKAKHVIPTHAAKFKLAFHDWNEPLIRLAALSAHSDLRLLTPLIGERVAMDGSNQRFTDWYSV